MIRKDLFIKCLNNYKNYMHYEDMLANWGINIWERDEVANLTSSFLELLAYCCNDEYEDKQDYNNIDYFICEQDFGAKGDKYFATEEDGTEVKIHNEEELWNYLVKIHPEIVDNNEKKKSDYKPLSVEELKEIFIDNYE